MSDHPTWRLPATRPVAGQRDVTYVEADEALWRDYLRDRLASLTTGLTLVAIVAVAALGVGLWSVFADPGDDVSTERLRRLEQRVEQLDARLGERPGAQDLIAVREQQQSLDQRLRALEEQASEPAEETQAMIQSIQATQQEVVQLEERVADLEQTAP
jgi:uncharacterized protein HemX